MTNKITIKDIAEKLGVSATLVSIVLSGKGREKRFSSETIETVFRTAKEMGYRPNRQAQSLRTNKTGLLALVVPDISNPFYGRMARYLEEEASKNGYQLLIGSFDEEIKKFELLIDRFIGMNIEGFIIVPASKSNTIIEQIQTAKVPFIFLDRFLDGIHANYIVSDNKAAAMSLTQALITQGADKVVAVCYQTDSTAHVHRLEGFEQALIQNRLEFKEQNIYRFPINFKQEDMEVTIKKMMEQKIDGIFFTNNVLGIAGLKILSQNCCDIPADMKVACFDYSDAFQLFNGGIWCAEQDLNSMCSQAFETISNMIKKSSDEVQKYVPVRLINPKV